LDNHIVYIRGAAAMPAVVRAAETRRTETPNAVMHTLASPTLGPTTGLSVWRVSMREGQRGPLHVFDAEQVLTVLRGGATVAVAGETVELDERDTIALPAGVPRQIAARGELEAIVTGQADARARVPGEDGDRGTPPWIA
jgi:quercetin dioxygenase-like cupin family protein